MKKIIFIFVLATLSTAAIAAQEKLLNLVCPIQKQYVCSSEGCKENPPSVTIKVHQDKLGQNYYSRCDNKGCDRYESSVSQSGAYVEIVPIAKSSRLKIYSEDMSFMETSSMGLTTFISFGECQK